MLAITLDASLRTLNTFGVPARARRLITLADPVDLKAALVEIRDDPRVLVLAGGSNVLLADDVDATVLHVALSGRRILRQDGDTVLVEAAAGENWHAFVLWTLGQGLSGLENLALIPGTVGASPIQNIGAYGVEMRESFDSLDAVDRRSGQLHRMTGEDCRFGYRDSVFKSTGAADLVVLAVRFRLATRFEPRLGYGELLAELTAQRDRARESGPPDALSVAHAVIAIRQRKLPDPARLGNAGSFFRNPVVDGPVARTLTAAWPDMPHFPADDAEQRIKLSAGWLIEQCGWKGRRIGDAGVHERHALVLVNHGGATGAQLLALAEQIRNSVAERFGVTLEPEPTILQ